MGQTRLNSTRLKGGSKGVTLGNQDSTTANARIKFQETKEASVNSGMPNLLWLSWCIKGSLSVSSPTPEACLIYSCQIRTSQPKFSAV